MTVADTKTTKTVEPTGSDSKAWEAPEQKVKTLDSTDFDLGWTAQAPTRPEEPPELNPVTLKAEELPDNDAVAEQGIDVKTYLAYFTNVEKK
jgi:hypothetical protein